MNRLALGVLVLIRHADDSLGLVRGSDKPS